eukprot:g3208.t1
MESPETQGHSSFSDVDMYDSVRSEDSIRSSSSRCSNASTKRGRKISIRELALGDLGPIDDNASKSFTKLRDDLFDDVYQPRAVAVASDMSFALLGCVAKGNDDSRGVVLRYTLDKWGRIDDGPTHTYSSGFGIPLSIAICGGGTTKKPYHALMIDSNSSLCRIDLSPWADTRDATSRLHCTFSSIQSVAVSPDSKYAVLSVGDENRIVKIDTFTGKKLESYYLGSDATETFRDASGIAISPCGKKIVVGSSRTAICIVETKTKTTKIVENDSFSCPRTVAFAPDGSVVVVNHKAPFLMHRMDPGNLLGAPLETVVGLRRPRNIAAPSNVARRTAYALVVCQGRGGSHCGIWYVPVPSRTGRRSHRRPISLEAKRRGSLCNFPDPDSFSCRCAVQ